jgi:DNA-binding SARP family transcriptional activator
MRVHRARGELQRSIADGRRVLAADPLREEIHRELMSAYHDAGQSAQAIRQYEVCRDVLRKELGIAPEPETQALRSSLGSLDGSGPAPHRQELQLALDLVARATEALRDAEGRLAAALRAVDGTGDGSVAAPASPAWRVDADSVSQGRSDGDRAVSGA